MDAGKQCLRSDLAQSAVPGCGRRRNGDYGKWKRGIGDRRAEPSPYPATARFPTVARVGSDFALLMTGSLKGCLEHLRPGFHLQGAERLRPLHGTRSRGFCRHVARQARQFATDYTVDAAYAKGFCQSFDFSLGVERKLHPQHPRPQRRIRRCRRGVHDVFDVITNVTGDPVTGYVHGRLPGGTTSSITAASGRVARRGQSPGQST